MRQWDTVQTGQLSGAAACGGGMGSLSELGRLGRTLGRIQMEKMIFRFQLNLDFGKDFEKFYKDI
jgi:hypothetical protein